MYIVTMLVLTFSLLGPNMPVFESGVEWVVYDTNYYLVEQTDPWHPGVWLYGSIPVDIRHDIKPGAQYHVWYKYPHALAQTTTVVLSGYHTQYEPMPRLYFGDLDDDNAIGLHDAMLMLNALGATPLDANWNKWADIDHDGIITFLDFWQQMAGLGLHGDDRPAPFDRLPLGFDETIEQCEATP